jgi:hypothetical protein
MNRPKNQTEILRILVALFAAFLLVACGGGGNDLDPNGNGTSNGQVPNGEDPEEEEPEEEEPEEEEPEEEEPEEEEPEEEEPEEEEPEEPSPLAKGTFIKRIEGSGTYRTPFREDSGTRYMYLLRADDIAASGEIKAVRFQRGVNLEASVVCPNVTLRAGHSSVTDLDGTFDANLEQGKGRAVAVVDDAEILIPLGDAGEFLEIVFETPFSYNGTDNLVLELVNATACTGTVGVRHNHSAGYTGVRWRHDPDSETGSQLVHHVSTHLVFEGGDNRVVAEDGGSEHYALLMPHQGFRSQFLVLGRDIGGEGSITGIRFDVTPEDFPRALTYSMTLSTVDAELDDLEDSTVFAENHGDDATDVASDLTIVLPAGASEFWMPIDEAFHFDGNGNLLVDIVSYDISHSIWLRRVAGDTTRVIYAASLPDSEEGLSYGTWALEPTLRFHGATVDRVELGEGLGDTHTFTSNATGRTNQYLYYGTELGTGGTITRMACRLWSATSSLTAYPNFQVVMSHTEALELDPILGDNLPDPVVVYEGTFIVPAGLIQGDWIEIPLDEGFAYDATQNLVIQVKSDGGDNVHRCIVSEDAERYENRRVGGASSTSLSGNMLNQQQALRLWIDR